MRNSLSVRYALVVCVAGVILASCNSTAFQSSVPGPTTFNPTQAQALPAGSTIARETGGGQPRYNSLRRLSVTERLGHSFGAAGSGDGYDPQAALLYVNGTFYGTTADGGMNGYGTVFAISSNSQRKETVLHSFDSTDGAYPVAELIDVNGTLYGTTFDGGANGTGTVFSITQSGNLTTLYSFGAYGGSDGNNPRGALTECNGTLCGTTSNGGTYDDGTVFSVTTTGQENVLYSFAGGSDGSGPDAGLIKINGRLYGTTIFGGPYNRGIVFSVTTSGSEKVLHSFSGSPDGAGPEAGLTYVDGTIYGTTSYGGIGCTDDVGCGTVFAINASGNESVLYSFAGSAADGVGPAANLLNVNGTLYGTTRVGGAYSKGSVFSITTSGQEAVLYSFKGRGTGRPDGQIPSSGLIDISGVGGFTLFGTTEGGGAYTGCQSLIGCGTVYALTP
jgi:uncharacterized repeat protein (TIGR03803 family)